MMRQIGAIFLILLMVGACTNRGKLETPIDNSDVEIERLDRSVTFALDPQLDALVLDYDCSIGEAISYDYGDTVATVIRDTFQRRFAVATEVAPELADYVLAYSQAVLHFTLDKQMLGYEATLNFSLHLLLLKADATEPELFMVTGRDTRDSYFSICVDAPDMITELSPTLMRRLTWELARRLGEE